MEDHDKLRHLMLSMEHHDQLRDDDYVRAPFGWPGAKSRSVTDILPHIPYRRSYCEPFGGSGAVLLSRQESPLEIFNDKFSGVTCFYRCIRDARKTRQLMDRLECILHSREEFMWCKSTWKNCEDEIERAARWWYMVVTSFSALGRNFGRTRKPPGQMGKKLPSLVKMFPKVHGRMRNVQVENLDWRMCFKDYDSHEMVWYLDPPFYKYFKGVYECEMTEAEHAELLERIFQLEGFVAISGYESDLYNRYPWTRKHEWDVRVTVLSQAFTESNKLAGMENNMIRGTAKEVLYIKE